MTPISRRGLLAAVAVGIAGQAAARRVDATEYVVEQDGRCLPITPLSGDETVEEFYDYRTPNTSPSGPAYSSYGTTDLQRPETSICFLYDGPEGLSLVVVHDELNDGTNGGAVTFRIGGLEGGSWVVRDDDYSGSSNYDGFTETDEGWKIDWTWANGRSDGGVYKPLGGDFTVTIDPAFNEAAALYGDPYEGEITDWQFLSGDRSDPDRISLSLDRPLTIRTGSCGRAGTPTTTPRETTTEEGEDDEQDDQPPEPIHPKVEVLPGKVNPRSRGRLPVVVHSSARFDATSIRGGTVRFGPKGESKRATPVERIRTDADGDGYTDLELHFWMDATGIDWDTDEVELTGETHGETPVEATIDVELVPNGDDEDEEEEEREDDETEDENENDETESEEEDESERESEDESDEEDESEDEGPEDSEERDEEGNRGRGQGRGNGRGSDEGRGGGDEGERGNGNGRGRGRGNRRGNGRGQGRGNGHGGGDE